MGVRGTDLRYADIFGDEARIFAYEVDGLDYTFRQGLPYPVPVEGAAGDDRNPGHGAGGASPKDEPDGEGFRYYVRDIDLEGMVECVTGEVTPEALDRYRYGSA